jgi:2',3'-cyclic-nucleotide 2'-phosphodiesterase (5'-nucleotidase family)
MRQQRLLASVIAASALVLALSAPGPLRARQPPTQQGDRVTLSIVGTNDLHGGLLARDGRGGVALLGGYVNNLRAARAKDGGAVVLVDAGDMFQGTLESNLSEGAAVVQAYNTLGYAAAAVGNHEFDFGPVGPSATPQGTADDPRGALKARAQEARFPFLAANLIDAATGLPVAWTNVRPSAMVEAAGIRIGIVGVMTARALSATIATNVKGLSVAPLAPSIATEATRLRSDGATVVIVASHAGGSCARFENPTDLTSCDPNGEIMQVARALAPGLVDAIVAGHSHAAIGHQVQGIPITEANSTGRSFGRIDLVVDRAARRVVERRSFAPRDLCARVDPGTTTCSPNGAPAQYEGLAVTPDAALEKVIEPAVQQASALKATPLGVVLDTPVRRANIGTESPLGNLFTDAFLAATPGAEVAINNTTGGLRADLPAGALTYGRVFEVFPFDNRLVPLRLTGAELRTVLTAQLRQTRGPIGIAGIRVRAQCGAGAIDVTLLRPSGAAIRDDESLLVVTTDFIATGGDGILAAVMPPQGFEMPADSTFGRDVVVEAMRRRGGRLSEDQLIDKANPRWAFPGSLPVSCTGKGAGQ